MHAVVVRVSINDREAAEKMLRDEVVPRVSQAPGFVAGYWTRGDEGDGMSMIVFESEDAARGAADQLQAMPPRDEATVQGVEVRQVVANA